MRSAQFSSTQPVRPVRPAQLGSEQPARSLFFPLSKCAFLGFLSSFCFSCFPCFPCFLCGKKSKQEKAQAGHEKGANLHIRPSFPQFAPSARKAEAEAEGNANANH